MTWKQPGQRRRDEMRESAAAQTEASREVAGDEPALGYPGVAPVEISHVEMDEAVGAGAVVPLGQGLPWVARYLGAWWVEYENGWLRVTDDGVAADLDEVADRLYEASAIAEAEEPGHRRGSDASGGRP